MKILIVSLSTILLLVSTLIFYQAFQKSFKGMVDEIANVHKH